MQRVVIVGMGFGGLRAARAPDPVKRHALLTFVVVGGGPAGVEFAGIPAGGRFPSSARGRDDRPVRLRGSGDGTESRPPEPADSGGLFAAGQEKPLSTFKLRQQRFIEAKSSTILSANPFRVPCVLQYRQNRDNDHGPISRNPRRDPQHNECSSHTPQHIPCPHQRRLC